MSKYLCGRCHRGFDDLQVFGDHPCAGDNPALESLRRVVNMGAYSIDFGKLVDESIERHRVRSAVDKLEDSLRRGDLSA